MRALKHPTRTRFLLLLLALEIAVAVTMYSADARDWAAARLHVPLPRKHGRHVAKPQPPPPEPFTVVMRFPFDAEASLTRWEEKVFRGKSEYRLSTEGKTKYLEGASHAASSGLYMKMNTEAVPSLFLDWTWRARVFPKKRSDKLADRAQDDFAARIYVIFAGTNFFNTRVIEYIWDERLPVGTVASSPFSGNVKLFVVASGTEPGSGWKREERNVFEDFTKLFGSKPEKPIAALGLMSDSDNTGTESAADFGDFVVKVKKGPPVEAAPQPKEER